MLSTFTIAHWPLTLLCHKIFEFPKKLDDIGE
jgi:hypothetical protein